MDTATQVETQGTPNPDVIGVHPPGTAIPLWLLASLAVAALVALIALFFVIGRGLSHPHQADLEQNTSDLADGIGLVEDPQVLASILQLRVISYWLAYPTSDVLLLKPPGGTGNSQGVLRTADDGHSAMLMVAGMQPAIAGGSSSSISSPIYQVWLIGGGQRVQASQLRVDPRGWGATTIYLDEPISKFDAVEVTTALEGGPGSAPDVKVLEGKIGLGAEVE